MSLNCDTVIDLVAIYQDGVASDATKSAVLEHLRSCAHCKEYYKQYGKAEPAHHGILPVARGDYALIAKKMRVRRYVRFLCTLLAVAVPVCSMLVYNRMRDK